MLMLQQMTLKKKSSTPSNKMYKNKKMNDYFSDQDQKKEIELNYQHSKLLAQIEK